VHSISFDPGIDRTDDLPNSQWPQTIIPPKPFKRVKENDPVIISNPVHSTYMYVYFMLNIKNHIYTPLYNYYRSTTLRYGYYKSITIQGCSVSQWCEFASLEGRGDASAHNNIILTLLSLIYDEVIVILYNILKLLR